MQAVPYRTYTEDDRPGSALSNHSTLSQGPLKVPSRPPPMPPVAAPDSDDIYDDSQHSSSPTGDDNGNVTFKVTPPTPDFDKTALSFDPRSGKQEEVVGPPRRPAPQPPAVLDESVSGSMERDRSRLSSVGSASLGKTGGSQMIHVNAHVNVINSTNSENEQSPQSPSSPKMSSPLPPPPTADELNASAQLGGVLPVDDYGTNRNPTTLPRSHRVSSSSSNQQYGTGSRDGTMSHGQRLEEQISQSNVEGFRQNQRFPEFSALATQQRIHSQEMLSDRSGFLTMQRPPPSHFGTMGQVRAATLSRATTDGLHTLPARPSLLAGGGMNPLGIMVPMSEEDELLQEDKSLLQRFGSGKYLSVSYCAIVCLIAFNLYACQYYQPGAVKKSTIHIFSVLLYIIGVIFAVFLIFVCQLSKHDPKGFVRDHRHCSVYLRGALIFLCLLTSLHHIAKISASISFITDFCMEEHIPKLFHYGFVLVFCYLEVYLIIVHSKVYISIQKCLVSVALAHFTALNLYLIFTTVVSEVVTEVHLEHIYVAKQLPTASTTIKMPDENKSVEMNEFISRGKQHQCQENYSSDRSNKTLLQFSNSVTRYGYPFAVNFAVLATAFIINMWCNVKKRAKRLSSRLTYNLSQRSKYFNCHHTSIGILLGLIVFLVSTIFIFLFAVYQDEVELSNANKEEIKKVVIAYHVFLIILMVLMIATIFKCIISFQLFSAKKTYHNIFDKPLLLISLVAIFVYYLFCIVSCFGHFLKLENDLIQTILPTLSYTMCLLEALLQVIFLLDALKRQATRKNDPGSRKYIVFILACNVALWILMVYRLGADIHHVEQEFYWDSWVYIRVITTPFVVYFYLHSVACFFDIWQFSYN